MSKRANVRTPVRKNLRYDINKVQNYKREKYKEVEDRVKK